MKRWMGLVLTLCLLLGVTACGTKADSWQEQYDLGIRYLEEDNYEEAVIAFTAAIEIEPKQHLSYIGLADAWLGLGNVEEARKAVEQGLQAVADGSVFDEVLERIRRAKWQDAGLEQITLQANGPVITVSCAAPGLKASYPVNMADTETDYQEYNWEVLFEDGTHRFGIATSHWKFEGAEFGELSPAQMQHTLWILDEGHCSDWIADAEQFISGDTITWTFTIPEEYRIPGAEYVITGSQRYEADF